MKDFFGRQEQAKRNTAVLLVYFSLAVIGTVLAVYGVFILALALSASKQHVPLWNPSVFTWVSLGTLMVVAVGSLYKTIQLSSGGSAVAVALGGRLVNPQTRDPLERRLLNVVEEMSIASGIPVPQVYVLDRESSINAFAAGRQLGDAVVAVTRGTLQWLTRDELQGVIAHEFSHILNGDMRLNIRLMGLIAGIAGISVIGQVIVMEINTNRNTAGLKLIGLALLIVGSVGAFFASLIQAAVSRQREFLADAAAVQFTRLPDGLAGALKKIGACDHGSRISRANASEVSHMFFSNGLSEHWLNLTATHPPLIERIRALDPAFNGEFIPPSAPSELEELLNTAPTRKTAPAIPPILPGVRLPAGDVFNQMGVPGAQHLAYAESVQASWSEAVDAAAREPLGATLLVYGLLLSDVEEARQKQLAEMQEANPESLIQELVQLAPQVKALPRSSRLPLVERAIPTLRQLSVGQYDTFDQNLTQLIQSDQQVDLFELTLRIILRRHLQPHFRKTQRPPAEITSFSPVLSDCAVLLSALAYAGHTQSEAVAAAFQQGVERLGTFAEQVRLLPQAQCTPVHIEQALGQCVRTVPKLRIMLIRACGQTVSADGIIKPEEAELLRAFADALECPIPPLIGES